MIDFEEFIKKHDITRLYKNNKKNYAHIKDDEYELLEEHSKLTLFYAYRIISDKKLSPLIKKLLSNLYQNDTFNKEITEYLYEMFLLSIYYHDLGKTNPSFQKNKMHQEKITTNCSSNHALYSAISFYKYSINTIYLDDKKTILKIKKILALYSYVISRHHSQLQNVSEVISELFDDIKKGDTYTLEALSNIDLSFMEKTTDYNNVDINSNELVLLSENIYVILKMLNSIIIASDYYATYEYMKKDKIEFEYIDKIDKFIDIYYDGEFYKEINDKKNNTGINVLRNRILKESLNNVEENKNIYYLESPTGSGKSNISINLAFSIIKKNPSLNKIIYVFPFNTLIEQTYTFLKDKVFQNKVNIGVINSISNPNINEENDEKYIEHWNTDRLMYNYPVVLTSHVHLFETLFGVDKESQYGFVHLSNSVIIIDEIQSYKNNIWDSIIFMLNYYSNKINIKFIIMSATLPKLNKLLSNNYSNIKYLITNPQVYYEHPLFKNRVKLNFDYLDNPNFNLTMIIDKIQIYLKKGNKYKILVEFISKKTAREFYSEIKNRNLDDTLVFELTGDDASYFRKIIIDRIKNETNKSIILVSTQVIEAGIDLDFDIGFKNYSLFDSEEQFLGRINRSCKKDNSVAYFFAYDNLNIYKNDYRKKYNIKDDKELRKWLENKCFESYYELILSQLKIKSKKKNSQGLETLKTNLMNLDFTIINKNLKLIDSISGYTVFIPFTYVDSNENVIDGEEVFNNLKNIYFESDYEIRKYKFQKLNELLSIFTFNILEYDSNYKIIKKPDKYNEKIGDIYYMPDMINSIIIENGIVKLNYDYFFDNKGFI